MEQYFFKITASFSSKNKLYESCNNFIHSLDNTLIKDKPTLEAFKKLLQTEIDWLNKHHSRCKPLELKEIREGYSINPDARIVGCKVEGSWQASFYSIERAVELEDGFLQTFIK